VRRARRDLNEPELVRCVEPLGGLWLSANRVCFDGWLWNRQCWNLCEIKQARKEGWKDEFTEDQHRLIIRLNERHVPYRVLRTQADVLALLGARVGA